MTSEPLPALPERSAADTFAELGRAAVAQVPLVGGPGVELFRQLVGTGLDRRRDEWLRRLADLVEQLRRVVDVDQLSSSDGFVSAVVVASQLAIGQHLEEKLEMLKAVLFNAAVRAGEPRADVIAVRFLRLVDELELDHIDLLRVGSEDTDFTALRPFDELDRDERELRRLLVSDLERLDLLSGSLPRHVISGFAANLTTEGASDDGITPLGQMFLRWLSIV